MPEITLPKVEVCAFVCITPLQLLLAQRLIQERKIKNYVLLNFNPHDSKVLRNYFAKVSVRALESEYVLINSRILKNFYRIKKAVSVWKKYKIIEIYLSSFPHVFIQYIVRKYPDAAIFSFDDGAVNLIEAGVYKTKAPLGLRQKISYFLLRWHKDQDWIKRRIVTHFTIFPLQFPNIVERERLQFLSLFESHDRGSVNGIKKKVKVFLGFDLSPDYAAAVKAIAPDIYLAHPMEKNPEKYKGYRDIDMISEEYLQYLLNEYEAIDLYACKSTVLLNVTHNRIKKYVVDIYGGASQWQQEYNHLAIAMGCNIIDFTKH